MNPSNSPLNAADATAAEARREACRRRILENSSNRLAKISGRTADEEAAATLVSDAAAAAEATNNVNDDATAATIAADVVYPDPEMERDIFQPSQPQSGRPFAGMSSNMFYFNSMNGASSSGASSMPDPQMMENLLAGLGGLGGLGGFGDLAAGLDQSSQSPAAPRTPAAPAPLAVRLMRTKVHIAAIGALTYLLASNDLMFRSHVFTMFLLWEAVELFVLKPYDKDRSSYLGIVFLVSGIPSEHSSVVMRWFATFRRVLKDVAIFVFFFVVAHLLFEGLWLGQSLAIILNGHDVEASAEREYAQAARRLVVDTEPEMEFEF